MFQWVESGLIPLTLELSLSDVVLSIPNSKHMSIDHEVLYQETENTFMKVVVEPSQVSFLSDLAF